MSYTQFIILQVVMLFDVESVDVLRPGSVIMAIALVI